MNLIPYMCLLDLNRVLLFTLALTFKILKQQNQAPNKGVCRFIQKKEKRIFLCFSTPAMRLKLQIIHLL